jgi:hypothetical protein
VLTSITALKRRWLSHRGVALMNKPNALAARLLGFLNRNTNLTIDRARPGASGIAYDMAHVSQTAVTCMQGIIQVHSSKQSVRQEVLLCSSSKQVVHFAAHYTDD